MKAISFFPSRYTPRPEQVEAIGKIESAFDGGKKIVAFQGPTGSGKSFVAMSIARKTAALGQKTHILTAQKLLQTQYQNNFPSPEVEVMKGRSNYPCSFEPLDNRNASRGYCRRIKKSAIIKECLKSGTLEEAQKFELPPEAHSCDYWAQMTRAMRSSITLFNFQSFLFQQRLGRFGKRDLLILDECHNAESVLMQFVQLTLSDKILKRLGIRLDFRLQTGKDVLAWLEKNAVTDKILAELGGAARTENVGSKLTPQETDQLQTLLDRIGDLEKYLDLTQWVVDVTEEVDPDDDKDRTRKLRVRPVFVSLFAKELLFSKADRTLAMSATILDPKTWARNLGIPFKDLAFVEVPCLFPVKNRPIFLEYAGNMSWKTLEATLPKLYPTVSRILDRHKGQRGIIHGHSERLCKLILENVGSPRFIHLDQFPGRNKTELMKAHLERPDSVIVASGFHEGVDLHDDLARFQIITKIPWPSTEDKLVKVRMETDGSYLPFQAALKLIQSYGRAVRHKDDFSHAYITDAGFDSFASRCGWLLPKWFTDAIQKS
jgi:Rad3-related DNA helicase